MHDLNFPPDIELRQLRVFVRVCELRSFTRAAAAFAVTQPTIGRLINDLEKNWGGELFYRTGRGVTPSELGRAAFERATQLLNHSDRVSEELRSLGALPSGEVSLGLPPSVIPLVVPGLVNELATTHPGIKLKIVQGYSDQIERWRLSGEIEVGVSNKYQVRKHAVIKPIPAAADVILIGKKDGWNAPPVIPFAELANYRLVLPAPPNALRVELDNVSARLQVPLNIVINTDAVMALREICLHCDCYTISSPGALLENRALEDFASSRIVNPSMHRSCAVTTTHQRPISSAAREVADRVEARLKLMGLFRGR